MGAITLRFFDAEQDYPTVSEWWRAHGWEPVNIGALPKLGIIAEDEAKEGVCAGWLYMDNSCGVSMLEWMVTSPKQTPLRSVKGLSALIRFMQEEAERMDYRVMLTSCRQDSLGALLERHGFQKTDDAVKHFLYIGGQT